MKLLSPLIIVFCFMGLVACKTKNIDQSTARSYLDNQIELDLVDTIDPKRIEVSFYSIGLRLLCTIDKASNIQIYQFDTNYKTLDEMLAFIGNEVGVEGALKTYGCSTLE